MRLGLNMEVAANGPLPGGAGPAGVVTTGLIRRYRFTEQTGATIADSVGANNASVNGVAGLNFAWVVNAGRNSMQFIPSVTALGLMSYSSVTAGGTWSISIWIYPIASSDNYGTLCTNTAGILGFYYRGGTRKVSMYIISADNLSSATLTEGAWHHIVASCDGTNVKIYIDNVLDGTYSCPGYAGSFTITGTDSSSENFNGYVSNMCFYNTALSLTEVAQNYNNP